MALQIRRGTEAERTAGGGVVFAEGELIYVTDTDALYVGDGSTAGGVKLTDNSGAVLGTYITADTINSTLDLQQDLDLNGNDIIGTGNININGTITATGNVNIGDDANSDTVDFAAKITSTLTPNADSTYDIGGMAARWRNGYFTGLVVNGQVDAVSLNADVVADDSTVMVDVSENEFTGDLTGDVTGNVNGNLTGNVTGNVTGDLTGNSTGYHTGDIKGSVFGNDSTPIVDAVSNTLNGNLTGNVTGNVTGNITGDVTGEVKGSGGGSVLNPLTGPADAELSVLNITATGTITGDLTGDVVGNTTGYHTGDVKGSVFSDGSTVLVDAVAGVIPGSVISGAITANLTGNVTGNAAGDHTGTFTGNVFTTSLDSADSSAIVVTPSLQTLSDVQIDQELIVGTSSLAGPEAVSVRLRPGRFEGATLVVKSLVETDTIHVKTITLGPDPDAVGGEILCIDPIGFESQVFTSLGYFNTGDADNIILAGNSNTLSLRTFNGDLDTEGDIDDPANFDDHFIASKDKVDFGVPAKFVVVADDTARTALVPSPEKGMVILMEAGTAPAATNQLQYFDGSNWVNV